jgi:hypothetical protein
VSGGGNWSYSVTKSCGGTNVSQHVFKCEDCTFLSASSLVMGFDWTCQRLAVEVGTLDAMGALYTDFYMLDGAGEDFASAAVLSQALLESVYNDTIGDDSRRGFALSPLDALKVESQIVGDTADIRAQRLYKNATFTNGNLTAPSTFATYLPGGTTKKEDGCCRNISLTVKLVDQIFFTMQTDSEKVTASQLFSSIIGLTGVLAFFGKALYYTDLYENVVRALPPRPNPTTTNNAAQIQPAVSKRFGKKASTSGVASSGPPGPPPSPGSEEQEQPSEEQGQPRSGSRAAESHREMKVGGAGVAAAGALVVGGTFAILSD